MSPKTPSGKAPAARAASSAAARRKKPAPLAPASSKETPAPRESGRSWHWHRDRLRTYLARNPVAEVSTEEVSAHLEGMPPQYWERINEAELAWGLQTIHRFLHGLVASPSGDTPAVVTWRHFPKLGCTKVLVSTWDRAGLLTKFAGYTSALRLNIIRAEVFTRADDIVLDVFWVCDQKHSPVSDVERLKQLAFLIEGGLIEPPRFVSTWACHSHKYLPKNGKVPTKVWFNNDDSADHTILTVEAAERLGLLHDMLQALNEHHLTISDALIDTVDETARDIFHICDERNQKIIDPAKLKAIEQSIVTALE